MLAFVFRRTMEEMPWWYYYYYIETFWLIYLARILEMIFEGIHNLQVHPTFFTFLKKEKREIDKLTGKKYWIDSSMFMDASNTW